jgi:hypothetical protein
MPARRRREKALGLTLIVGLLGCGQTEESTAVLPSEGPTGAPHQRDTLDDLRALGYAEVSEERYDGAQSGVVHHLRRHTAPGHTAYTSRYECAVVLMDDIGRELKRWQRPDDLAWSHFQFLDQGDLIVIGQERSPDNLGAIDEHRYLLRLSFEGEERWKVPINAHHDVELTPDGFLAVLSFRRKREPGPLPGGVEGVELREDTIELLDLDGRRLDQRSLHDVLVSRPDLFELQGVKPTEQGGVRFVDLIHSNSVEFLRQPSEAAPNPLFAPGHVLVSTRHQDAVVIFDWESGELVWAWGPGELLGPHDATLLGNGHLLIFDNGLGRGWSRVVELDPLTKEVVWEHRGSPPESFYSKSRGSSQRLENGNTLIAESDSARAFEVSAAGKLVWAWINPARNEEGQRVTIVRVKRFPETFFEPFLTRD